MKKISLSKIYSPLISIFMGLFFGYILLLLTGHNANEGFKYLFIGGSKGLLSGNLKRLGDTFLQATPLIFTGLSVAFSFKTGLFNIGASGQFLVGGFTAVFLGTIPMPPVIHPIVCVLGAGLAGGLWAFLPGLLKSKFNIHEVVICIMTNYIAIWFVQYFAKKTILAKISTETIKILPTASLRSEIMSKIFTGSVVNIGLIIALVCAIIIYFVLNKTTFGFELKAVGFNQSAAKYSGMRPNKNIIYAMVISGILAGIGGASFYTGFTDMLKLGVLPNYGFDGLAVSLLALNSPIGVIFSAFLFGYLKNGSTLMASSTNIPSELIDIVISFIIYFSAIASLIENYINKLAKKYTSNKGAK